MWPTYAHMIQGDWNTLISHPKSNQGIFELFIFEKKYTRYQNQQNEKKCLQVNIQIVGVL